MYTSSFLFERLWGYPPLDLEASPGGRAVDEVDSVDEVDMVNEVDLRQAHARTLCGHRSSAT
ncbi:MAG: hypothetical protein ACLP2U_09950 [Syntrophobacteraceae bacterium]